VTRVCVVGVIRPDQNASVYAYAVRASANALGVNASVIMRVLYYLTSRLA